jgi:cytidyltransferase-like protein
LIYSHYSFCRLAKSIKANDPSAVIVFANGCFSNLHEGHLAYLGARQLWPNCSLFVAVNSDEYLSKKHPSRKHQSAQMRALIVAKVIEPRAVCIFNDLTPQDLLCDIQPDVYLVGEEYRDTHMSANEVYYVPRIKSVQSRETLEQ